MALRVRVHRSIHMLKQTLWTQVHFRILKHDPDFFRQRIISADGAGPVDVAILFWRHVLFVFVAPPAGTGQPFCSGAGKTIAHKPRPSGANVVDLMEALKQSIRTENTPKQTKRRKTPSGQKEMLMSVSGKKSANKAAKESAKSDRHSA